MTVQYSIMELETEVLQLQSEVTRLEHTVHAQQAALKHGPVSASTRSDPKAPLLWRSCPSLVCGVVRPHVVTLDNEVYVGGGNTRNLEMSRRVHKFVPGTERWESLPITPYLTFALTTVKGFITTVGGVNTISSLTTGDLFHFDGKSRKWKKTFPAMPTKRCAASATSTIDYAVVAGGIHEDGRSYLSTVEVLDVGTMKWSVADPLPKPTTFMCITTCNKTNRIYLLGGLTKQGSIHSVFSCILTDLVRSSADVDSLPATETDGSVWEDIAQTPYHRMGCIALGGKLVVASGLNDEDHVTKSVHVFDPVTQQWTVSGEMAASRSSCSLASLGEGQLMVVGGYTNPQNWMNSLTTDVMECVNLCVE